MTLEEMQRLADASGAKLNPADLERLKPGVEGVWALIEHNRRKAEEPAP